MLGLPGNTTTRPPTLAPASAIPTHNRKARRSRFAAVIGHRHSRWLVPLLLAVVGAVALTPYTAHAGDPSFTQVVPLGRSEPTQSVAVGDFNNDGFSDIVQGNDGQSYVYLNDGRGGFTRRTPLGNGEIVLQIMVGDLNSDGYLDIISPSKVYLNDGRGDFSAPGIALAGGSIAYHVAVGDLNSDGFLDIILGGYQQASYIYLNDGQGRFPDIGIPLGNDIGATSMAVGDLSGDGFLDIIQSIIQSDAGSQIYVYLNNGRGSFTQRAPVGGSENTVSIALGDLNSDGYLDIISQRTIYLNDGQGTFSTPGLALGEGWSTHRIAVGDLNNDGFLDIVQGNDGQSYVYLNDGQGHFPATGTALGSIHRTYDIAIGDLNADGFLDIVQGNYEDSSYIYLSDEQGGFSTPGIILAGVQNPRSGAVGDLNRDGFLDIVLANGGQSNIYLNDGWGGFSDPSIPLGSIQDTWGMAVGDLNGDSFLDIVQGNAGESYIYLNDRRGHFPATGIPLAGIEGTRGVAVGDLNNDGFLDIILANNGQSYAYLNDGLGGFMQRNAVGDNTEGTSSVALGDLNSDGLLDVVLGNNADYSYVYLNNGQGNFPTIGINLGGIQTFSVAIGDLNSDGFLDLVKSSFDQNYAHLNDGLGHFPATGIALGSIQRTYSIAIGDLNSDGFLDIAQSNESQGYIYLNDGQGGFSQSVPLGKGETALVMVGDLNNDGLLDIVLGNKLYRNTLRQATALTNHSSQLAVTRPSPTGNANFFSTPVVLNSPTIPITYTLFDQEGDSVGRVEAAYSLNGGGKWLPAIATQATITQNLSTGRMIAGALTAPRPIPANEGSPLQAKLTVTPSMVLADVEVWLTITHTNNAALAITLQSPQGRQVPLVAAGQAQGQNFQGTRFSTLAATPILSGAAPYTGTYQPVGNLTGLKGETSNGVWTLVITNTGTSPGILGAWGLRLQSPPATHVFHWDTLASGFFGQSDNVVMRLVAYSQPLSTTLPITGSYRYTNSAVGPYQWPYASATTFPFRMRGTQVRVLDSNGNPTANALVYRLPQGAATGAEPMPSAGQPLTTTSNGYLPGRGALAIGDQLVALQPLRRGPNYTVYTTSAAPNENGLALQRVTQPGVQTLQVSAAHPLVLFDLDIALEWDAVNDGLFYAQLTTAIQRASAILFDVSDGQIALGEVRIHPDRTEWLGADVVLYANNNLRPRASMGGVVDTARDETQGLRGTLPNAYLPGQVRMGPLWDPFGQNNAELTQDWQRALAHELAHYLLFLPDNYLGVENGLVRITNCPGSFMTDAYNPGYSEFLTPIQWRTPNDPASNPCLRTVAASLLTGRSDWETVTHFYPELHIPQASLSGPALLPLNVTRVRVAPPPMTKPQPVAARNYDLRDESGSVTVLRQAQAYVLQSQGTPTTDDDALLYLGSTGVGSDRILVRGAVTGDKVCVLDSASDPVRTGCETVTPQSTSIQVRPVPGWRPNIEVTPLTSTTFQLTVTQALSVGQLSAKLLPAYGPISNAAAIQSIIQPLTPVDATHYTTHITTTYPVFEGFVRVYAAAAPEQQQAITQFFLSEAWGPSKAWSGANRAWGANIRSLEAPTASGDGKVTILNLTDLLADTGTSVLQAVTDLPTLPPWLTPVGPGYRFAANSALPRTILFQYNQRDVPPGYETTLAIYYLLEGQPDWERLTTGPLASGVDGNDNLAVAVMPDHERGEGIYALMATVELPPLTPGWNPFNYPVVEAQSVTRTLAALGAAYTTVYAYQPDMPLPWPVYDRTVDPAFAPLVNTLMTMTFGRNYLIYATAVVTPYISVIGDGGTTTTANAATRAGLVEPPALFYGNVIPQPGFVADEGMVVNAKIGAVICGESQVQRWQGTLVLVIQVKADSGNGCGKAGQTVQFEIGGQGWPLSAIWDNRQTQHLLASVLHVYLPVVAR